MNEILSQEEIDALKDAVSKGEVETIEDSPSVKKTAGKYDFAGRNRQLVGRLPGLKVIYSGFSGFVINALASVINKTIRVELTSVHQLSTGDLVRSGGASSCLCSIKFSPFKQPLFFVMDSTLMLSFIDAACGGEGRTISIEGREEMGSIEQKLVWGLAREVVKALEESWRVASPARMELHGIEFHPQVVTSLPSQEVLEVAVFQVSLEESHGELTLALPHGLIESMRTELMMEGQAEEIQEDAHWARALARSLGSMEVALSVELAQTRLNFREFLELKEGDIVYLDPHPDDQLVVSVEGLPKFFGRAGALRNSQAVQISCRIDDL